METSIIATALVVVGAVVILSAFFGPIQSMYHSAYCTCGEPPDRCPRRQRRRR